MRAEALAKIPSVTGVLFGLALTSVAAAIGQDRAAVVSEMKRIAWQATKVPREAK